MSEISPTNPNALTPGAIAPVSALKKNAPEKPKDETLAPEQDSPQTTLPEQSSIAQRILNAKKNSTNEIRTPATYSKKGPIPQSGGGSSYIG